MKIVLTLLVALAAFCAGCLDAPEKEQGPRELPKLDKQLTLDLGDGVTMKLVLIPAGKFLMGSPEGEQGRDEDEGPQHKVTITKAFYMGTTEVTEGQWGAVMGTEPRKGQTYAKEDPEHAASYISWDDATAFCGKLSTKIGRNVRLPTEAEWEYACRVGSTTRFCYGNDPAYSGLGSYAWYDGNANAKGEDYAHAVGRQKPNAWGLYDMHGNVWEWCQDSWHDNYQGAPTDGSAWAGARSDRVLRGGSWGSVARGCRSAIRDGRPPVSRRRSGFRVVVSTSGHQISDFPEGLFFLCGNPDCKAEFTLTLKQFGQHHEEHWGEPVPCPKCRATKTVRAEKCPHCGRSFPLVREQIVCPHCGKTIDVEGG